MRKSKIPFFLINFFTILFFGSCSTLNVVEGYEERMVVKDVVQNPYFADPQIDYVYKANITVYGNELTGIFIAKKINETTHRIVFTTEFGNTLLDFEISETDFKVNAIVDELNRKILITTLKEDFRLLLKKDFAIERQFTKGNEEVLKSNFEKNDLYLFRSLSDTKLLKIAQTSKTKEKKTISFASENGIFADTIVIQHYNLKLRIALNYFKQN